MPEHANRSRAKPLAAIAAASTCILVALSTTASSQDGLPPEGEFVLTLSLVETESSAPVAIGPNQLAQAVNQVAHLFNDEGSGFLHYAVGRCASFQLVDLEASTIEITGFCNYRDADGDQVFERISTASAVPIGTVTLSSEWTGGTGKYADIAGTFITEAFGSVRNGNAVLVGGRNTGGYQIVGGPARARA